MASASYRIGRIDGRSMRFTFAHGQSFVFVPCGPAELRLGDIVVIEESAGRYKAHRLFWKTKKTLWLKGDANWWWDRPVDSGKTRGKTLWRGKHGILLESPLWVRIKGLFASLFWGIYLTRTDSP